MNAKKLTYIFTWLLFSGGYLLLSYWLQTRGFYNLQSYFIEYKKLVTLNYEESILKNVYFTEPFLLYFGSSMVGFPKLIHSSYIFNALLIGGLTNHLVYKAIKTPQIPFYLIAYILLSPVVIYAGVSGGSLALYIIFYYLFFSLVLKYSETFSVFHLTLLSILIGIFILLNLEILKFLLLLIPVFFFSSFYKAKGITGSFYNRASMILSNDSQRRKFFSSFFSSIFVVTFIPLMGISTFLILNKVFGGQFYYFIENYGNNWNSYSPTFPYIPSIEEYSPIIASNTPYYLIGFFSLSILTIFQIFNYGGRKTKSILLLLGVFFLLSEIQEFKIEKISILYLSMLPAAAIASAFFFRGEKRISSPVYHSVFCLMIIGGIYFEWQYFHSSIQYNESLFPKSITGVQSSNRTESIKQFKKTFEGLAPGRVLVDDAIFYPELTTLSEGYTWEGHFSSNYQHALQQPELYADYVVMTKSNHPLYLSDIVATAYKRLEMQLVKSNLKLIFEDDLLEIYQISKSPIAYH